MSKLRTNLSSLSRGEVSQNQGNQGKKVVLISLVGGRPLPNILLTLQMKPDYHYLVVSKDSVGTGRDYEKTLAALPKSLEPQAKIVAPYIFEETLAVCREIASQHKDDEIIFNTTLGPKTMAFGAYEAARELKENGEQVDVCLLARDMLVWIFENREEPVNIGLGEYFQSYGWAIRFKTDNVADKFRDLTLLLIEALPVASRLLKILRDSDKGKGKRTCRYKGCLPDDQLSLLNKIADLQIVSNVTCDEHGTSWTINSTEDGDLLLKGDWLEYHVYQIARSLTDRRGQALFHECGWGAEDVNGKGEIDFVGIFGGQMLLVSCKTESGLKRAWFEELHSKAEQLGKGMCSGLLITTVSRNSRNDTDLQDYRRWAQERQIVLVMAEDIPHLGSILQKVVSADQDVEPKEITVYPRI